MQSTDPRYHGPSNWWEDEGLVYARKAKTGKLMMNIIDWCGGSGHGWESCNSELAKLDSQCHILLTADDCKLVMTELGLYIKQKGKYKPCKPFSMHAVALYEHNDGIVVELENGVYCLYQHRDFNKWDQSSDYEPQIDELNDSETYSTVMSAHSYASNYDYRYITSGNGFITISDCPCRYKKKECKTSNCGANLTIIEGRIVDELPSLVCLLLEDGSVYDVFTKKVTMRIQMHNRCRKPAC
jgi:hypothetical protein